MHAQHDKNKRTCKAQSPFTRALNKNKTLNEPSISKVS